MFHLYINEPFHKFNTCFTYETIWNHVFHEYISDVLTYFVPQMPQRHRIPKKRWHASKKKVLFFCHLFFWEAYDDAGAFGAQSTSTYHLCIRETYGFIWFHRWNMCLTCKMVHLCVRETWWISLSWRRMHKVLSISTLISAHICNAHYVWS